MERSPGLARLSARSIRRWQDGVRENFLPLEFSVRRGGDFVASLIGRQLGGAHLAQVSTQAYRVFRTRALAERSDRRYLKLFWQLAGSSCVEQEGQAGVLHPGSWTFYDTSRPYTIESTDASRFAVMLLPPELCNDWAPPIVRMAARPFRASGAARIALASVMTALRDAEAYDALSAGSVVASVSSLMLAAVRAETAREPREAMQAKLGQACHFISSRVDNPNLTPDDVATALQVSRRTLYAWFKSAGRSPFAFIQQTRLERCRLALADPAADGKTITRIAFDNGFSDMAHFSRLFKATFGTSPRDYRKRFAV